MANARAHIAMRMLVGSVALLFPLLLTCRPVVAAATFTEIGVFPTNQSVRAFGVSADGSTVVGRDTTAAGSQAFRWTAASGVVDLGVLPGTNVSTAFGASASGAVVVGNSTSANSSSAYRWTAASGLLDLGTDGRATGTSADGSAIAGFTGGQSPQPFRWTSGAGAVPFGFTGHANALTSDGSVIVGDTSSVVGTFSSNGHAFRWTAADGVVSIDEFAPGIAKAGSASAVSADGSVIVGFHASVNGTEAFRWTAADGAVDLGDLPGGTYGSWAKAVSADGSVLVGIGNVAFGASTGDPFIWDDAHGMRDLRTVLTDAGADLTGWTLTDAAGISADGQTIIGSGTDPAGHTEAWIATVPEPASTSIAAIVAAMLMRPRRRCPRP